MRLADVVSLFRAAKPSELAEVRAALSLAEAPPTPPKPGEAVPMDEDERAALCAELRELEARPGSARAAAVARRADLEAKIAALQRELAAACSESCDSERASDAARRQQIYSTLWERRPAYVDRQLAALDRQIDTLAAWATGAVQAPLLAERRGDTAVVTPAVVVAFSSLAGPRLASLRALRRSIEAWTAQGSFVTEAELVARIREVLVSLPKVADVTAAVEAATVAAPRQRPKLVAALRRAPAPPVSPLPPAA